MSQPYPFERKTIDVDGFKYTYVEAGNATGPILLFLHNGGGDHRCWYYQLKELSDSYFCVALDLPGFGGSTRPERVYSVEWIGEQVLKFIQAKFDRPVTLIGHCIGASVALEVTQLDHSKVKSLVLVNVCGGPPGMSSNTEFFYKLMPRSPWILNLLYPLFRPFIEMECIQRKSLEQLFRDPDHTQNLGVYFEKHISAQKIQHISRKNLILGMPSFAKYSKPFPTPGAELPIQLIWGEKNPVMKPTLGKWLSEYLNAPIAWVKEGQHMVMSEDAGAFNDTLRRFLGN